MLSTQIKTHYILIKEWEKNQIKKIPITTAQYELYKEELQTKKHNEFFQVDDVETKEVLYDGRASKIDWFEEIKRDPTLNWKRWICSFWTRHSVIWFPDNCDCDKKFKTLWILFKDEIKKLGYNVNYDSDITKEMQDHYLRENKLLNK